jgi:hypothetical protein
VIGDKGLRSLVDLDLNINQHEPDPWQSQQQVAAYTYSLLYTTTLFHT